MNTSNYLQPITEAIREARRALEDAEWNGEEAKIFRDRLLHLEEMQKRGQTLAPRF